MKTLYLSVFVGIIMGISGCSPDSSKIDKTTVKELDLNQYLGRWYEIARFDHRFERNLVGVTANYSLKEDGSLKVVNAGYKHGFNGKYKETIGKAKRPDASKPGELKVSFFLNFYSDYKVLELDTNYQFALVGSIKDNYLWILSRTPQLSQENLNFLLKKAKTRGYDVSKLIYVKQK